MSKITEVYWTLHTYCSKQCYYCPKKFWGNNEPRHFEEYINAAKKVINHFNNLGRIINWTFDGGEPLEFFELPMLLKLCKETGGKITLHTNGGNSILPWLALKAYVDDVVLTYHHWQNSHLINYIVEQYITNNKKIKIIVPLRPEEFDNDLNKIKILKDKFNIQVEYQFLFKEADYYRGFLNYSIQDINQLKSKNEIDNYSNTIKLSWKDQFDKQINESPKYSGKKCMAGIEKLIIGAEGFISGSNCNNINMGNIFQTPMFLSEPDICRSVACMSKDDQKITKFI